MTIVDSVVLWPNGKIYFFSGDKYFRYDIANEAVDGDYPLPIQDHWKGLGGVQFQGALAWPNGKAYFFSRDRFYTYDIGLDRVEPPGSLPTKLTWHGVLEGALREYRIDTALIWPNGKTYLFQHDTYYRCDTGKTKIDPGYPELITNGWPGLWKTGQSFTGAFIWPKLVDGRQKAYFFHHTAYIRYDIADNRADDNYPQPIEGNWSGL